MFGVTKDACLLRQKTFVYLLNGWLPSIKAKGKSRGEGGGQVVNLGRSQLGPYHSRLQPLALHHLLPHW